MNSHSCRTSGRPDLYIVGAVQGQRATRTSGEFSMFSRGSRSRYFVLAVAVLPWMALAAAGPALLRAQNISTAQLNGTVRDPSGAVVPDAAITVADASKGLSRSTASDGQGNYQVLLLPPGTYSVAVQAAGFNQVVQNNVVLTVGEQAQLPIVLSVGGVTEKIVVSAGADV